VSDVRDDLDDADITEAERQGIRAVAYVWGWQDRGGPQERDTDISTLFGQAYFEHAVRYFAGRIGAKLTLRDAWVKWQRDEPLDPKDQRIGRHARKPE